MIFHCKHCLKIGPAVNLDPIWICARHRVAIFVDGELKHEYIPPEGIDKELAGMEMNEILKRVVQIEEKKKVLKAESENLPPLIPLPIKPLSPVLEKEAEAEVIEIETEELFIE